MFIEKCRKFGQVDIGLNTDEFIERYKGSRPVMSYDERERGLRCMGVNRIYANNQGDGTIKDVVEKSKPKHIIIGSDWLRKPYLPQIGLDVDYLEWKGINLIYVPYEKSISTSEIKNRCKSA
jgi:glycerol-3-phosphate cytidylyltransferase-like family protein